ncbi:hypothetical protein [Rothia nasimurium]|uniref:hypothetical protein n=1 Tax=Rothia nasimurium TaxID=85336 RepID=UPI001F392FF5|nr:hypothetical protein [Rothia nasimurium]
MPKSVSNKIIKTDCFGGFLPSPATNNATGNTTDHTANSGAYTRKDRSQHGP